MGVYFSRLLESYPSVQIPTEWSSYTPQNVLTLAEPYLAALLMQKFLPMPWEMLLVQQKSWQYGKQKPFFFYLPRLLKKSNLYTGLCFCPDFIFRFTLNVHIYIPSLIHGRAWAVSGHFSSLSTTPRGATCTDEHSNSQKTHSYHLQGIFNDMIGIGWWFLP